MGNNAGAGQSVKEVILYLHAVHNVRHLPNESYYGMASDGVADSVGVAVTSERPARLHAGYDTVLTVRVFLHERGAPSSADRLVGHLSVPIREMLDICGPGIYQTWFILDTAGPGGEGEAYVKAEKFRMAFGNAVLQVTKPRICLTLVEATADTSSWLKDEANREAYYGTLLASHKQNSQMCRAYFELVDSLGDACNKQPLQPVLEESRRGSQQSGVEDSVQAKDLRQQLERLQQTQQMEEEAISLQIELDQVTDEANRRIEKGNENILRLKAQVKHQRDVEFPELQQRHVEVQGRLAVLRKQNRSLKEGGGHVGGWRSGADLDKEIVELKKQITSMSTQKDALMHMLKKANDDNSSRDACVDQAAVGQLLTSPRGRLDASHEYGKLLPDPSDVFFDDPWARR